MLVDPVNELSAQGIAIYAAQGSEKSPLSGITPLSPILPRAHDKRKYDGTIL